MSRYDVPGLSIALVLDHGVVWSGAYGYADVEQRREMTTDAVYRAESISKSVTAWGVMRLVEQGAIGLDDPLQQHLGDWVLPESNYSEEAITVRQLLSHSAGMPLGAIGVRYNPEGDLPSLRETLSDEARLVREPGTSFSYSNIGYHLVELLVEEVSGRDFAAYMADEVLGPLGMENATFTWSEHLRPAMPTGYGPRGSAVAAYVYPQKASGGLFATVSDIARFVIAEVNPDGPQTVLSRESIQELHALEVSGLGIYSLVADGYGLGHFVEELRDGRLAVWHGGQGTGWMTHFHAIPESGAGIVILTNSQRSWPLMAAVLNDWARWSGAGSVKMGRITYGVWALWAVAGAISLASLWLVYRLVRGARNGARRWAPLSNKSRIARLLQAVLGAGTICALGWSAAQPYLMISSVFPGVSDWAGLALLLLATVMIVSATFPPTEAS